MAESLFCLQWDVVLQDVILNKKKRGINIYDQLIIFMIKSTPMNLDNVLVRINKLLFVAPSHISNIADIIHRTSSFWEKKNSSFENTFFSISSPLLRKLKFLRFFRLSCNDNNYMTYNWPNSAFFNFQEYAKTRELQTIERFHSRGKHLCKFIGTKENVYIRKEFNSQRIYSVHQHGRRFVVLEHQYGRRDVMWKRSIFVHSYFFSEKLELRIWRRQNSSLNRVFSQVRQ